MDCEYWVCRGRLSGAVIVLISFELRHLEDQPVAVLISGPSLRRQDKRPDQVGTRTPLPRTQPPQDAVLRGEPEGRGHGMGLAQHGAGPGALATPACFRRDLYACLTGRGEELSNSLMHALHRRPSADAFRRLRTADSCRAGGRPHAVLVAVGLEPGAGVTAVTTDDRGSRGPAVRLGARGQERAAGFGGDGEPGRHRQAHPGISARSAPLAAEQLGPTTTST